MNERETVTVRDADDKDISQIAAVYLACMAGDSRYLSTVPSDAESVITWFHWKPLVSCLVAEKDSRIVGVFGFHEDEPGEGAGEPGGAWLEVCRLAVHPAHRGGDVMRNLARSRDERVQVLGADRLWGCYAEGSRSLKNAKEHGWRWWADTEFKGAAAGQRAVILVSSLSL